MTQLKVSTEAIKEFAAFVHQVDSYVKSQGLNYNLEDDPEKETLLKEFYDATADLHRLNNTYINKLKERQNEEDK